MPWLTVIVAPATTVAARADRQLHFPAARRTFASYARREAVPSYRRRLEEAGAGGEASVGGAAAEGGRRGARGAARSAGGARRRSDGGRPGRPARVSAGAGGHGRSRRPWAR